jgi:flagellar biosynthetic protein FliO
MPKRSFIALLLASWPLVAFAAEPAMPAAPAGHGAALMRMIVSLALVCGLAWMGLKWASKRLAQPAGTSADRMRVLARLPIEPRKSVVVVRVGDRTLVLGSSDAGLETLAELTPREADALISPAQSASDVTAPGRD